ERDDARPRYGRLESTHDPCVVRDRHVEQDDVGPARAQLAHRLVGAGGRRDDLDLLLLLEQPCQPFAVEADLGDDQDANHRTWMVRGSSPAALARRPCGGYGPCDGQPFTTCHAHGPQKRARSCECSPWSRCCQWTRAASPTRRRQTCRKRLELADAAQASDRRGLETSRREAYPRWQVERGGRRLSAEARDRRSSGISRRPPPRGGLRRALLRSVSGERGARGPRRAANRPLG